MANCSLCGGKTMVMQTDGKMIKCPACSGVPKVIPMVSEIPLIPEILKTENIAEITEPLKKHRGRPKGWKKGDGRK
jgi:hypothetical protein